MNIDSGVPIPDKAENRRSFPFELMSIGDSFWVEQSSNDKYGQKLRSVIAKRNNRNPDSKKFIVRRDGEGFRCWRVA